MNRDLIQSLREQVQRFSSASRAARTAPVWAGAFGNLALGGGAVHEVLAPPLASVPRQFALMIAGTGFLAGPLPHDEKDDTATRDNGGAIVWLEDPADPWYAPAVARAAGVSVDRMVVLRPASAKEALWALAECLGSAGVSATIARVPPRLTSIDARRLQLAAERGGGVGVLLRTHGAKVMNYAAATRWLVEPVPGDARTQRWHVTLLHGQGGRVGTRITLEADRETHRLRTFEELADQSVQTTPTTQPRIAAG